MEEVVNLLYQTDIPKNNTTRTLFSLHVSLHFKHHASNTVYSPFRIYLNFSTCRDDLQCIDDISFNLFGAAATFDDFWAEE